MTTLKAEVILSYRFPQELIAAVDKARGAQSRRSWLIEAMQEKLAKVKK